jgi:hypothetical protein
MSSFRPNRSVAVRSPILLLRTDWSNAVFSAGVVAAHSGDVSAREAPLRASDYPQARVRVEKSVVVALGPVTSPIGTETLARKVELRCGTPSNSPGHLCRGTAKVAWAAGLGTNVLVGAAGKALAAVGQEQSVGVAAQIARKRS